MTKETYLNEIAVLRKRKFVIVTSFILIFVLAWSVFAVVAYDLWKTNNDYNALHQYELKHFNPKLVDNSEGLVLKFSGKTIDHLQIAVSVWLTTKSNPTDKVAYRFMLVRNVDLSDGVEFFVEPPSTFRSNINKIGADITLLYNGKPFEFKPVVLKEYK